nr:uncharacterized protein LOC117840411 [Setaria viridis]
MSNSFDNDLTNALIKLGILPANFFSGKDSPTYEFYNPSVAARQFGLGQLLIRVYFAGRAKFRDALTKSLDYNRLCDLVPDSSTIDLNNWIVAPFAVKQFKLWWAEWKQHLFCVSPTTYCNDLDPDNIDPNAVSESRLPPTCSRSGRLIENHYPYTPFPLIGYHAPTIEDITTGRSKQMPKKTSSKKTSRQVRARIESANQLSAASAESLAALILTIIEEVDPQATTEAGAAAASLFVEAVQAVQIAPVQSPQQLATIQAETGTPAIPPNEVTLGTSIVPFEQPSAG